MAMGWEQVRADVLARIQSRHWPPGCLIPTEADLAAEFGVARATVNRALRDLADAGLLERRRRAGTRVAALPVRRATFDIPVIRQEVAARGQTHSFRLLDMVRAVPPVPVASRIGWPTDRPMLWLETLHLADGLPFAHEMRWLNPDVLPHRPVPDFRTISVNEWLVENVAYARGDIAFYAENADPRAAEVLGVPPGAALLVTERTTFGPDAPITFVRLVHGPGYRVQSVV